MRTLRLRIDDTQEQTEPHSEALLRGPPAAPPETLLADTLLSEAQLNKTSARKSTGGSAACRRRTRTFLNDCEAAWYSPPISLAVALCKWCLRSTRECRELSLLVLQRRLQPPRWL
jgi:hypothetical protein